jgi:hypothetical protein
MFHNTNQKSTLKGQVLFEWPLKHLTLFYWFKCHFYFWACHKTPSMNHSFKDDLCSYDFCWLKIWNDFILQLQLRCSHHWVSSQYESFFCKILPPTRKKVAFLFCSETQSDLAFEKLKFLKVSTNFIFSQNWKKWAKMSYFLYFFYLFTFLCTL